MVAPLLLALAAAAAALADPIHQAASRGDLAVAQTLRDFGAP